MSNRMYNNKVAARYAKALFESTVESGDADAVARDLEAVNTLMNQVRGLAEFMENPGIPAEDKLAFIDQQFGKNANPWVARLLRLLVENKRMAVFPHLVVHFNDRLFQRENMTRAEVVTAVELEEELRERIRKTLQASLGYSRVEIQNRVDPGILGGVIIKVQDRVIDGSYIGRLEELRKQLVKS